MIRNRQRPKLIHVFGSIVILISVIFLFQNCGGLAEEEKDLSSLAADMPFAYDTVIDHLAYMSVSNPQQASASDTTFFTFRAGAFDAGAGMKLRSEFNYAARNLVQNERAEVLSISPENKNTYLQLSIRNKAAPENIFKINNNPVIGNFVGNLSNNTFSSALTKLNGQNRLTTLGGSPIVGSLKAFQNENISQGIRNEMIANSTSDLIKLTLVYGTTTKTADIMRGYTEAGETFKRYFGRYYNANFKLGHGITAMGTTNFTSGSERVLSVVTEGLDDLYSQSVRQWTCPPNWSFIIVRKTATDGRCPGYETEPNPAVSDPNYSAYVALRRLLPSSQWGVNLTQRCIVPLSGDPYPGIADNAINYGVTSCNPSLNNCPHYVSICKRN